MDERAEIARVKATLQRLMKQKGIKAKPLSQLVGRGETYVRDMLAADDLKIGTLHRFAAALDVSITDIVGSGSVVISGRIGAGGSVIYDTDGDAEVGDALVPRLPGLAGELEAFEVEGSSMLPRYSSGDVIYIQKGFKGVRVEDIGEYCAVRLIDGQTYVKQLAYGTRPGFFVLRSLNAEDIIDVEVEWAAPIIFVLPRAARRLLGY